MLSQLLSLRALVVAEVEQVVGGTSLILLSGVEVLLLRRENGILLRLSALHVVKPLDLLLKSFLSYAFNLLLMLFELLDSLLLICDREVCIKPFLFYRSGEFGQEMSFWNVEDLPEMKWEDVGSGL